MFGFLFKKKPKIMHGGSLEEVQQMLETSAAQGQHVLIDISDMDPDMLGEFVELPKKKGKLGRNDPCACGSGRKYKQCCLRH